tara:strand:- start:2343 stop:3056 length:714 start_codon:yes stop_codon:yes gene_type:complete
MLYQGISSFYLMAICVFILLMASCKHDPFPGPPASSNAIVDSTNSNVCDPDTVYFANDILPILISNCAYSGCHDAATSQDGVTLNNFQNTVNTGDVRAGDLSGSDLYEVITENDPDKIMPPPPNTALTQSQISLIGKWILQGAQNLNCNSCDSSDLRYNGNIQPIINQNCVNCHGGANPQAGLLLNNYQNVRSAILNNNLREKINDEANFTVMPPGGKMNACDLERMNAWINASYPE